MSNKTKDARITTPVGVLVYVIKDGAAPFPIVCTQVQDQGQGELLLGRPFIDGARRFEDLFHELGGGYSIGVLLNGHPDLRERGARGLLYGKCTYLRSGFLYTQQVLILDQVTLRYRVPEPWTDLPESKRQELAI